MSNDTFLGVKKLDCKTIGEENGVTSESTLNGLLSVGTWILIPFGFNKKTFCVLQKSGNNILLGRSSWCVSSAKWFSLAELAVMDGNIIGKGKYKWWRLFLPFLNDLIFPYAEYR